MYVLILYDKDHDVLKDIDKGINQFYSDSYNDVITYMADIIINKGSSDLKFMDVKETTPVKSWPSTEINTDKVVLLFNYEEGDIQYGSTLKKNTWYTPEDWEKHKATYDLTLYELLWRYKEEFIRGIFKTKFVDKNSSEIIKYSKAKNKKQELDFSKLSLDESLFQ